MSKFTIYHALVVSYMTLESCLGISWTEYTNALRKGKQHLIIQNMAQNNFMVTRKPFYRDCENQHVIKKQESAKGIYLKMLEKEISSGTGITPFTYKTSLLRQPL